MTEMVSWGSELKRISAKWYLEAMRECQRGLNESSLFRRTDQRSKSVIREWSVFKPMIGVISAWSEFDHTLVRHIRLRDTLITAWNTGKEIKFGALRHQIQFYSGNAFNLPEKLHFQGSSHFGSFCNLRTSSNRDSLSIIVLGYHPSQSF